MLDDLVQLHAERDIDLDRAARNILTLATAVWNAVNYETLEGDSSELDAVRAQCTAASIEGLAEAFEELVERKRSLFAHDLRLITEFDVRVDPDAFHITAGGFHPPAAG